MNAVVYAWRLGLVVIANCVLCCQLRAGSKDSNSDMGFDEAIRLGASVCLRCRCVTTSLGKAKVSGKMLEGFTEPEMLKFVYTISIKTQKGEVELDRTETVDGVGPQFGTERHVFVYDAALDGENVRYVFQKKKNVMLGTIRIDANGNVSNARARALPFTPLIWEAKFLGGKGGGRLRLRVSGNGRTLFEFDGNGEPVEISRE